jgi:hypothetical protein
LYLFSLSRFARGSRLRLSQWLFQGLASLISLIAVLVPTVGQAQGPSVVQTPQSLALARYIAWSHASIQFALPGPAALQLEASLPGQDKAGRLLALRSEEPGPGQYVVLAAEGDSAVLKDVIGPYRFAQCMISR